MMSGSWVPEVGEREAGRREPPSGAGRRQGRVRRGLGALLLAVAALGVASWAAYLPFLWCAVLAVAYATLLAGLRCYPAGERERLARMCILVIGGPATLVLAALLRGPWRSEEGVPLPRLPGTGALAIAYPAVQLLISIALMFAVGG